MGKSGKWKRKKVVCEFGAGQPSKRFCSPLDTQSRSLVGQACGFAVAGHGCGATSIDCTGRSCLVWYEQAGILNANWAPVGSPTTGRSGLALKHLESYLVPSRSNARGPTPNEQLRILSNTCK